MNSIANFLQSRANWCGIALSTLAVVLGSMAPMLMGFAAQAVLAAMAVLGYSAGFGVGGLVFGFPQVAGTPWAALSFQDHSDPRTSMLPALNAIAQLVAQNPQNRLPDSLQRKVLDLCEQLTALLDQWERSKGHLSLEDSFNARHIALTYLPEALKAYLSIPQRFAQAKRLGNGQTAQETFSATLDDLHTKVFQLSEDLAAQDAQGFLNHSQFLQEKFNRSRLL
jgi:hypothetical protein